MASINKRGNKWQVRICRKNFPTVCKTFTLFKDAQIWARNTELKIERGEALGKEIVQLNALIERYLRSETVEPAYADRRSASALDVYTFKLSAWLKTESTKSRKQKRSLKQMHADLCVLGFEGSYDRVAAFARQWKVDQLDRVNAASKGTDNTSETGAGLARAASLVLNYYNCSCFSSGTMNKNKIDWKLIPLYRLKCQKLPIQALFYNTSDTPSAIGRGRVKTPAALILI